MGDHQDFDAFQLGVEAGATLKRKNKEIAKELPKVLNALFSDNEFREAMVVAGVTSDRSTLQEQSEEDNSFKQQPLPISSRKIIASTSKPTLRSNSRQIDSEKQQDLKPESTPKLALCSSDLPETSSSPSKSTESELPEDTTTEEVEVETEQHDDSSLECVTCGQKCTPETQEDNAEVVKRNMTAREILWISLGMKKKLYDRSPNQFPFCKTCSGKLGRLMEISKLVGDLSDEFDNLRDGLCEGMVQKFAALTPTATQITNKRALETFKTRVFRKMKNSYTTILPGKGLIEQAIAMTDAAASSTPDKEKSNASDPLENNSANEENSEEEEDERPANKKQRIDTNSDDSDEDSESESRSCKERYGFEEDELENILKGKVVKKSKTSQPKTDFCCPKCPKTYGSQDSLKVHLKHHCNLESGRFECKYCDKKCLSKSELDTHERTHVSGRKQFECDFCDKTFESKQSRLNHHRTHKEKPQSLFQCKICEKTTHSQIELDAHTRTHTGLKPYKCEYCEDKSFAHKSNYNGHMKRHLGFKAIECIICSTRFDRMRNVPVHFRKHHPDEEVNKNIKRHSFKPRKPSLK